MTGRSATSTPAPFRACSCCARSAVPDPTVIDDRERPGLRLTGGRNFTAFEAEARADVCLLSDELATGLGRREQVMVEGRLCRVVGTVSSDEVIPDYSTARAVCGGRLR